MLDDLTITGNFPTACTQRRPSEGKKDEKEKKFNTVCKKGGKVQKSSEVMKKWEGSCLPLFSDSQIFSIDRSPASAQIALTAYCSNLQLGSLLSHLPPFCTPDWCSASTSLLRFLSAHQHLATAIAAAGPHHIPCIACSECCLEIQRPASVQEYLTESPLSL